MTRSAQFITVLLGSFFVIIGIVGIVKNESFDQSINYRITGEIERINCPLRYKASILIKGNETEFFMPKGFKDETRCRDDSQKSIIGQSINLGLNSQDVIVSVILNNQTIIVPSKVDKNRNKDGVTSVILGIVILIIWMFKRHAT